MSQKDVRVRVVGKHFYEAAPSDKSGGVGDLIRHEIGARITVSDSVQKANPFRLEIVEEFVPVSVPSEPEIQTSPPPPVVVDDEIVEAITEETEEKIVDVVATEEVKTKSNLYDEFAPKVEEEVIEEESDTEPVSIRELSLPPNQLTVLWKSGFRTIADLSVVSDEELLAIKGIGKSSLKKIHVACSLI